MSERSGVEDGLGPGPPDRDAAHDKMPDPGGLPRPWLGSYPPGVPPTFAYPDVPLTRFLDDAARDFPDVAATWFEGATISYSALLGLVDRLAAALADLGVRPGTRVGLVVPNSPAVPVTLFASLRLAAIVVPLHPGASPDELQHQLDDSACELVICNAAVLLRIAGMRLPRLRALVTTHVKDWLPFPRKALSARRRPPRHPVHVLRLADLMRGAGTNPRQVPAAAHDIAVIAYAREASRGVKLSHANLVANAFQARLWLADTQAGKERMLLGLHLHGLTVGLLNGVLSAATMLLLPRLDAEISLKVIAQKRPTLLSGMPAMYTSLVEHPAATSTDLSSIRAGLSDGPLPGSVIRRFQALSGGRLRESYGPAEACTLTHANPVYGRALEDRIGLPVTDTVAVVVDPSDPARLLPAGQVGQLAVSGPQVSANQPQDTGGWLRGGWLLTRDLAVTDEEGYFAIHARHRRSANPAGDRGHPHIEDHP